MIIELYDFISPKNHQRFYLKLAEILSNIANVIICAEKGYYEKWTDNNDIKLVEFNLSKSNNNAISRKIRSLKLMLKLRNNINSNKDRVKIVLTFDTITFGIGRLFINGNNVFIMHHKNLDELLVFYKRIIFKTYMNKVNHIVFEEMFKTYLVEELRVEYNKVFVIPLPVFDYSPVNSAKFIYDCVGLSNSNDESFIAEIINLEKESGFLKRNGLSILLRSKSHMFEDDNLKVINGYLSGDDYDEIIRSSKQIFLPLPKEFRYRVSGAVFDAFSSHKKVISSKTILAVNYFERYPNIFSLVTNANDLFRILLSEKDKKYNASDFSDFVLEHNDDYIMKKYKSAFKVVNNEN
jgi:hypothetical protein